jgi:hypothetical protein
VLGEDFRQRQGKPWQQFGLFQLAISFGINNAGLKCLGNVAVRLPRLSIQKPNGPDASSQVLTNLKYQIVRLVMLGNDFNDQVGGDRNRYLIEIDVFNTLEDEEHKIRPTDCVRAKPYIHIIQNLPEVVLFGP